MDVNGKAAIITGGGSGIGAEVARHCAKAGMKVALLDVNMDGANAIADEIGGTAVECDVTSSESAEAAIAAARAANGVASLLVNCAGIAKPGRIVGRNGPLPLEAFAAVIQVNLIGSFNMIRLAADAMCKNEPETTGERGVMISTASVAAYDGQIGQAAYSASKGGVVGMTLPIARDLARNGIRNMTIAPGIFGTPMLFGMPQEVQDSLAAQVPFPSRFGTPEEYARLALSICDNPMLNCETIRLDGAIRMGPR